MWLDLAIIGQKLLIRHLPIQEFLLPCPSSINSHTNWQVVSIPNISHLHIITWEKYINARFKTTPSYLPRYRCLKFVLIYSRKLDNYVVDLFFIFYSDETLLFLYFDFTKCNTMIICVLFSYQTHNTTILEQSSRT